MRHVGAMCARESRSERALLCRIVCLLGVCITWVPCVHHVGALDQLEEGARLL